MKRFLHATALIIFGLFSVHNAQSQGVSRTTASSEEVSTSISEVLDSLYSLKVFNRVKATNRKPSLNAEDVLYTSDEVIRQRMVKMHCPIPMSINPQVRAYINLYGSRRKEGTGRMLGLSKLYFPIFEQALDKYNLPMELKYLAMVESALNPTAVSRVGATGIWQFMYQTGRVYNLNVNSYTDDRRDVALATVAACEYFKEMYGVFHDWLLVIASYNCGPRNVTKAIARAGGKTNFWEIYKYLPRETQGYVPAFLAILYVSKHANEHGIVPSNSPFEFHQIDTLQVTQGLAFESIATGLDIPIETIRFLNPEYKKNFIPGTPQSPSKLILPVENVVAFASRSNDLYASSMNSQSAPKVSLVEEVESDDNDSDSDSKKTAYVSAYKSVRKIHKVRRGESLSDIADDFDCTVAEIKKWNKLRSSKIKPGRKLKIYTKKKVTQLVEVKQSDDAPKEAIVAAKATSVPSQSFNSNDSETRQHSGLTLAAAYTKYESGKSSPQKQVAEEPVKKEKPVEVVQIDTDQNKYIYHTVQRGDTLWNIAQRYNGVTVERLKELNKIVSSRDLKPGTQLRIGVQSGS